MTEATWGGLAGTPDIDWSMSAALEDVVRSGENVAEVTNLQGAVRAWLELDPEHRAAATLTPEHAIMIDGAAVPSFVGERIAALADRLPE